MKRSRTVGMGQIVVMNEDVRITWDRSDPAQIENARLEFERLRERGLEPYRVGNHGEQMTEFDPGARIIMTPPRRQLSPPYTSPRGEPIS